MSSGIVTTNDKSTCTIASLTMYTQSELSPTHESNQINASMHQQYHLNMQGCLPLWQSMTKNDRSNHLLATHSILLGAWYYASLYNFWQLSDRNVEDQVCLARIKTLSNLIPPENSLQLSTTTTTTENWDGRYLWEFVSNLTDFGFSKQTRLPTNTSEAPPPERCSTIMLQQLKLLVPCKLLRRCHYNYQQLWRC